jgi:hypothetical protein
MGGEGTRIAPTFLTSQLERYDYQLHAPAGLSLEKQPPGWVPQPIWILCRREESWPLPGIEPLLHDRSARSLVSIPTELLRFQKRTHGTAVGCVLSLSPKF